MRLKRYFGQAVLIASLVIAFTMSVEAKTLLLCGGAGEWAGGISGTQIYSQIKDIRRDNLRLYGTVYVKNDIGQISQRTGLTNGVGTRFYVTRTATYRNLFVPNKAWCSDVRTIYAKGH